MRNAAIQDFKPTGEHQIPLHFADEVKITAEYNGQWYRGQVTGAKTLVGIFPCNHVALRSQGEDDSVVSELVQVLKEWGSLLKTSFQVRALSSSSSHAPYFCSSY